ncbi:3227_t:CDS:2 [Dentiscutata erythropus]|uniref:3227_t:CDS:1 n=1 Tax=Dentiscutata erythropus TaxID=1348616 RepID=A0A9N9HNC9_9GLOM|nr:3227_t:CDS:2 [Dentiscutata erythropus]
MEEFLLTKEPLDIVRISTALFVRVEQGEWTGVLEKEVENFETILENVLERVPSEDVERIKKLRSFGTGKKLAKRVTTAFEDLCSLTEMKALVIDAETWPDDANANLELLIRNVNQLKNKSVGYEKTMWERIEVELEEVDVESLGFDHPICSGVLDAKSKPFTEMPLSLCDVFREPFQKYKLDRNDFIVEACIESIRNEESKINLDEDLRDVEFGRWLDEPEKLREMTKRILETLFKVWKSPKYEAFIKKGKPVNEGSYVCEVLAPLLNIVMSDLPGNPAIWDIWGEEGSLASTIRKGSRKFARKPDYMAVVQLKKGAELEIVYLETGRPNSSQDKRQRDYKKLIRFSKDSIDTTRKISKLKRVFNLSSKRKILSIFAINIAEEAPIPLHKTSPNAIYPLIHALMTLRTAVTCTIHKILHNSDSGDSEYSSGEMTVTASTPKNS